MENARDNIIDGLLVKYLLGEASETEQETVRHWLKESEEHKQHFYAIKLIWNKSSNLAINSTIQESEAWERFKQRTGAATPVATINIPGNTTPSKKWYRIAATMVFLISGGALVLYISNYRDNKMATNEKANKPATHIVNNLANVSHNNGNNSPKTNHAAYAPPLNNQKKDLAYNNNKAVRRRTTTTPAKSKNIQKQEKETHSNTYEDQCIETYKYHGPKYDSNF